jgi:hypothetical protein
MSTIFSQHPELADYLDTTSDYTNTAAEFEADGKRWLLVTQKGEASGGQVLFQFFGDQLLPVKADTIIDLNPSREYIDALKARGLVGPAPEPEHVKVADTARAQVNVFSSSDGPDHGNLACVWAMRKIVQKALFRSITRTDSTSVLAEELEASLGKGLDEGATPAGGIILSPTNWNSLRRSVRHGHVGLLGPRVKDQDRLIYSNSSARARWEQNFTLSKWRRRYEEGSGLDVLFYPIPAASAALVADKGISTESGTVFDTIIAPPDPLAGEGPPAPRGIVLDYGIDRASTELPISRAQAHKVAKWLKTNYGTKLEAASSGTLFSVDLLCGIVCQETAYFWVGFINTLPAQTIVERCVLDASGDVPGTSRSAFPVNTTAFRNKFGEQFTNLLIEEANKTRALRNYTPRGWVYKGYGIFQYDLQYVLTDRAFFEGKQWYSFDVCLGKAIHELKEKYRITGDLWRAVRAYNGSGASATKYANNVMIFRDWCGEA